MHEEKAFSVVPKASPWRPNHVTICLLRHFGESLQNGQLEHWRRNWCFAQETHKDTAISVWACQAGFWKSTGTSCQLQSKPHVVFHGVCEIALTEVLTTQMGVMWRSKRVISFELYKLNPLSPHCGSIARELVHCYTWGRLRIVTVHGNTVGIVNFFVNHTHTQFTEESKMATALIPQTDVISRETYRKKNQLNNNKKQ